ncbi:leucine-rich repeat-containing protein 47 [Lampetra fluviatilis]
MSCVSLRVESAGGRVPSTLYHLTRLNLLDMSCVSLSLLQPQLGRLSALGCLMLRGNLLTQLPEEIGQLTQLKLPEEIGQLTQLKLPEEIGQLTQLKLPEKIGQLTQLKLPEEIGQLTQLKLPEEIGQLTQLKLPEKIGQLTQLKLPEEIGQLTQLKGGGGGGGGGGGRMDLDELQLRGNRVEVVDVKISVAWPGLKILDLSYNLLTDLPHSLLTCSKLRALQLAGNPFRDRHFGRLATSDTTQAKALLAYVESRGGGGGGGPRGISKKAKGGSRKPQTDTDRGDDNIDNIDNINGDNNVNNDDDDIDVKPTIRVIRRATKTFAKTPAKTSLAKGKRSKKKVDEVVDDVVDDVAVKTTQQKTTMMKKMKTKTQRDDDDDDDDDDDEETLVLRTLKMLKTQTEVEVVEVEEVEEEEEEVEEVCVRVCGAAMKVRPYFVACLVRGLKLGQVGVLKRFLGLQTELHEGVCKRRSVATIATHDLRLIHAPLRYDARPPSDIQVTPLGASVCTTALSLVQELSSANEKLKKSNGKHHKPSGLHQYLHLLQGHDLYACLVDRDGVTISLPPITNSQTTKVSVDTTEVLVEVTSSQSLASCKLVMDTLITRLAELHHSLQLPGASDETQRVGTKKALEVMQVMVVNDVDGCLRVMYPSRTDLTATNINVVW